MLPGRQRRLVTTAILLGMLGAALEATAVAAALPTAVGELGGVARYGWVFSIFLLTSTTSVPLYGKLADLYGRRRVYRVAMGLFLAGSLLCGLAQSFGQLVLCRAIQGLGAGGVAPVGVTVAGDLYTLAERARVQALFSGVWAFASLVGPLAGGLVTDAFSWRWIFFGILPLGVASVALLEPNLRDEPPRRAHRLDVLGTLALTVSVALLLLALLEGASAWGWRDPRTLGALAAGGVGLVLFFLQERRAPEPILPLGLFADPVIAVASVGNALLGMVLFPLTAYVPLYGQAVLGGTATQAGTLLAPVLIGWPISSALAPALLRRFSYRRLAGAGAALTLASCLALTLAVAAHSRGAILASMLVLGLGLGFTSMPYLLAVQGAVSWERRGVATGTVQFFRTLGGAFALAALGALFQARFAASSPGAPANAAVEAAARAALAPAALERLLAAFMAGFGAVFVGLVAVAAAAAATAWRFPGGPPPARVPAAPPVATPPVV